MRLGGFGCMPVRLGGGTPLLATVLESLNDARGTAFNVEQTSTVYAENMAAARCITWAWSANARMRNQFDPARMTDMLDRWLAILRIPNLPSDTSTIQRALVAATFRRAVIPPRYQAIYDLCATLLGPLFIGLAIPATGGIDTLAAFVPASESWSAGYWTTDPTGMVTWASSLSYIAILTAKPDSMDDGVFYDTVARVNSPLDSYLPSWMTYSIIRDGESGIGFFLDDPHNLDNERFD